VAEETSKAKNGQPGGDGKGKNNAAAFDWVTARSACSLPKIFKDLRLGVERDIETRNALRPQNSPYEFSVTESTDGFEVILRSDALKMAVIFALLEHAIQVRDNAGNAMFDVTLKFDKRAVCKLMVNGEECEPWQVQRMALEDLMFRSL